MYCAEYAFQGNDTKYFDQLSTTLLEDHCTENPQKQSGILVAFFNGLRESIRRGFVNYHSNQERVKNMYQRYCTIMEAQPTGVEASDMVLGTYIYFLFRSENSEALSSLEIPKVFACPNKETALVAGGLSAELLHIANNNFSGINTTEAYHAASQKYFE